VSDHPASRPTTTQFGTTPDPKPPHRGVRVESVYLPMRDGTRIAADVMRPKDAPAELRLPTILIMARYWRSFALRGMAPPNRAPIAPRPALPDFLVARGYAVVVVDSRGSGASSGSTPYPYNEDEIADYGEVVDWITRQPWSDGRVGSTGISFEAVTAALLPVVRPGATKAVVPQQLDLDNYTDVFFPGGIPRSSFIEQWQNTNEALDRNRFPTEWTSGGVERASLLKRLAGWITRLTIKGVRPVDADRDGAMLERAIAEHADNANVTECARGITFRDDPFGPSGVTMDDFSVLRYRDEIESAGTPLFTWGSWLDGVTADVVLRAFATFANPQWAVIGAWSHHYLNHGSPYTPAGTKLRPRQEEVWQELLGFLDHHLKGSEDARYEERRLYYYTMGEEAWKVTDRWPPAGSETQRWYFAEGNGLAREAPQADGGSDAYEVDLEASTGPTNRWQTQDGVTKVAYPDRAQADERLLTYTSAPLSEDLEVTGHPVVTLHVTSTATDGAFHVYLEDVDEDGRVVYLTEGQLRALHRRESDREPPLASFVPHHSFLRQDGMGLVPGEATVIRFGLLPTSALVREGHRLRIAIAGHDASTFARIPSEGAPTVTVHRDRVHASHVDLPVVPR
jgi:putative CocE/NonD family hydrolase